MARPLPGRADRTGPGHAGTRAGANPNPNPNPNPNLNPNPNPNPNPNRNPKSNPSPKLNPNPYPDPNSDPTPITQAPVAQKAGPMAGAKIKRGSSAGPGRPPAQSAAQGAKI